MLAFGMSPCRGKTPATHLLGGTNTPADVHSPLSFLFHDCCPTALYFCPFLPSLTASAATLQPCNWFHAFSAGCSLFLCSIQCTNPILLHVCAVQQKNHRRELVHTMFFFLHCFWRAFNFTVLTPIVSHSLTSFRTGHPPFLVVHSPWPWWSGDSRSSKQP